MSAVQQRAVDVDVLAILSGLTIEGSLVKIAQQLDRKMYTRVNDVLEAIGGKWNRKAKAHVFDSTDPAERLDEVIVTGRLTRPDDHGFFPTPSALADRLAERVMVTDRDVVLEPSAGHGALVDAILRRAPGAHVLCVELLPDNLRVLHQKYDANERVRILEGDLFSHDAQKIDWDWEPTCAVMNPPFARQQDIAHIEHVWNAWQPRRLVSVASAGVLFRQDRRTSSFRERVYDAGGIFEPLPEGSFRASGTDVNTCFVYMGRGAS